MDFVEYQRLKSRMTENEARCNSDRCYTCPLHILNNGHHEICAGLEKRYPKVAVDIVRQWNEDHPRKTNADKFEEVFGVTPVYATYQPEYFAVVNRDGTRVYNKEWLEAEYISPETEER